MKHKFFIVMFMAVCVLSMLPGCRRPRNKKFRRKKPKRLCQ